MYDVLKYIHENIKQNIALSDTAERFGYSKWHFSTKFHKYTGKSFTKYIRHFRLSLASLDILAGKKIIDIALDYGYDSISGFNKAFVSEFGCYPSEYKDNAKEALFYHERRKASMYQLTERCEILKKRVTGVDDYEDYYAVQRNVYYEIARRRAIKSNHSVSMGVADGIAMTIDNLLPVIMPQELIVGFNFADSKYKEEYCPENNDKDITLMKNNGISDDHIKEFFEPFDLKRRFESVHFSKREIDQEHELASLGFCLHSNHSVIAYEQIIKFGFSGMLEKIKKFESANGENELYKSTKKICEAALTFGEKYAAKAKELLEADNDEYNKDDLQKIINVCSNVPRNGAKTLHEAIQSLWFAHILNTWEDGINANSLGRLDQILYPYYKSDIENDTITKDEAFELICCLWLKLYLNYDVQQSCVGGTDENGKSCVNDLSYMMLDATEQLDFIRCLSVRYSQNTEKEFVERALEVVGHVQKGVPFFFNDDTMIPALESKGISHKDACDYTQIGCVETVIPGKSNPHAVTGRVGVLKALEYVLGNGYSMMYPDMKNGIETGDISEFDTYEKFYNAILCQIKDMTDLACSKITQSAKAARFYAPRPYKSMLTEGCLESGKDFNDFGAKYDYYEVMLMGVPNLADSLEVIRKFVYEEKKYTLAELKEILINDYPDESVRLEFINKAPKFGNDIESVDSIAYDIIDKFCDYLDEAQEKYGLNFIAQPFTFLWMISHGKHCIASPDGRKKGEILAYSLSPMQGRDFNGLTSLFNSLSKLPTKRTPGTTSAIVEIDPKLFTDRNIPLLASVLFAAGSQGLQNVQFNTIDADILMDAKLHPEKHKNLAVRVSGFSQKFNLLVPELQDHIISRTKHSCM